MKKCTELLKNGERSLVEVREAETNNIEKYVVCSYFDNSKSYENKWSYGHYFDVWCEATAEEQMKAATMYLYDIKEPPISYARLSEIATFLKDGLMEDDTESAIEYMKETCELTEEEAEYFGIKEMLYPKTYKVVELTMIREQTAKIKIVVPDSLDIYMGNLYNYTGDLYNLEPDWNCDSEWEIYDRDTLEENLNHEDVDCSYCQDDIWNYDTYKED